jgi:hypothetical protein
MQMLISREKGKPTHPFWGMFYLLGDKWVCTFCLLLEQSFKVLKKQGIDAHL